MKTYYIDGYFSFTDTSDNSKFEEPFTLVIVEKNKINAKKQAKITVMGIYENEWNDGNNDNIKIVIENCYQTTDDARCN